ncbi:ribbon-helix-helix protein, CopG family [uncultured Sneathiella sp.]|uniref:ribbon-helix-helix protein, CopG family n=1 Tax=uncultured Sneathiella sp. TaxID=879315 RepID=UPI0030EF3760|tara:strand:- start:14020 stop:14232 length:213 start_codon:yes stop_codon:yes gene_type:complete
MGAAKKGHRITVSLPNSDYAILSALAERYDISLSWLARKAITDFLERYENEEVQLPLGLGHALRSGLHDK